MNAEVRPRRIALVGLMGAGKTRVGRLAAAALRWPFVDADRLVEEGAGCPVPEIFRREGEDGFRNRESEALAGLAARPAPFIVATGGGVVERPENRESLRRGFYVVWLRIDPVEAARRLAGDRGRPLLAEGDPDAVLDALARRRDPLYRDLARLILTTTVQTRPEDLRDELLEALAGPPPVR